jgi:hypothetical protein
MKEAEKVLTQMTLPPPKLAQNDLATIYTGMGDKDKAFEYLDRARTAREGPVVRADPLYDPLHSDPRFSGVTPQHEPSRMKSCSS